MSNPNIINLNNLDGRYSTPSSVDSKIAAQAVTDAGQYAQQWKANTAYTSGQIIIAPDGSTVSAISGFTSGASYSASNWTVLSPTSSSISSQYLLKPSGGSDGQILTKSGSSTTWTTVSNSTVSTVPGLYMGSSTALQRARFAWGRADAPTQGAFHLAWFGDSIGMKPGGNNSYTIVDRLKSLLDRDTLLYNGGLVPPLAIWFDNPGTITNSGTPTNFTSVATITGTWAAAGKGPFEQFGLTSSTSGSKIQWAQVATGTGTSNVGRIYYLQQSGGGSFTLTTTSNGSFSAQTTAGSTALKWMDFNGGDGGVYITVDGSGPVTIFGREIHRQLNGSTTPTFGTTDIRLDQQLGVKASRFSVNGYTMQQLALDNGVASSLGFAFDFLKPDLAVIGLMTNDGNNQVALSTYLTSANTVAQRAKAVNCDVLFVGAPPYSSDSTNTIKQSSYEAQIRSVCDTYNCAFLSLSSLWGSYSNAYAAGLMNADGLHPTPMGITAESQAVYDAIRANV